MKRPIAELLTLSINAGAEATRAQYEHEAWQILRRKDGYVTHRLYRNLTAPLQQLVYSEWTSKKALEGARQHLQGTALTRRARSALSVAPRQIVVEIGGPVTSTKGLDLPPQAVAVTLFARLAGSGNQWPAHEEAVWREIAAHEGHLASIVFHGFDDAALVGWLSHWADAAALDTVRKDFEAIVSRNAGSAPAAPLECTTYAILRD